MSAIRRPSQEPYIGIMACETGGDPPFAEREVYARMCRVGETLGMKVYVFSPLRAETDLRRVEGFTYEGGTEGWRKDQFPLPDLVYDRIFTTNRADYIRYRKAIQSITSVKPPLVLNHGLKGKWAVLQTLRRDSGLRPYLPETERWRDPERLARWLHHRGSVFLKPQEGSQGKGALLVRQSDDGSGFRMKGRDGWNRALDHSFDDIRTLADWITRFIGSRPYLIQEYLPLTDSGGAVYDIRSLVQKNGCGLWEISGMAVRRGQEGSITSNLHGGGHAMEAGPFLTKEFGAPRAQSILETLRFLSERIPHALESENGRLAELGLDLGVDRRGNVWIIEVNSKPGRSVFHRLCQVEAEMKAARNPMAYAGHLLRRRAVFSPAYSERK